MKEIGQKAKPMNSENFQPQRALHPAALCCCHKAGMAAQVSRGDPAPTLLSQVICPGLRWISVLLSASFLFSENDEDGQTSSF